MRLAFKENVMTKVVSEETINASYVPKLQWVKLMQLWCIEQMP